MRPLAEIEAEQRQVAHDAAAVARTEAETRMVAYMDAYVRAMRLLREALEMLAANEAAAAAIETARGRTE